MSKGNFPLKVQSLDENFILVKNNANLSFSSDLYGFHLYATDLCLNAELNGYSAYAIKFNITHKSRGNKNQDIFLLRKIIKKKYNYFFRSRWIQTTCTTFYLTGSKFKYLFENSLALFLVRMWNGLKKRLPK